MDNNTPEKNRFLISVYYSDWIEATTEEDALHEMYQRIHDLKRHEWEITCQDMDIAL